MARRLGLELTPEEEPRFESTYRARFDAIASGTTRPFPGMVALLGRLRDRRLGVVTAKIAYQAAAVVEATALHGHFAHVQGWAPHLAHKPAPDLLVAALDALGADARDAVYVGDAITDVRAGHAAGMRTIAVTWGFGTEEALRQERPTRLVRTVEELEAALQP